LKREREREREQRECNWRKRVELLNSAQTSWKSFKENTVRRRVQVLYSSIVKSLRKSYYIELLLCQVSRRKDLSSNAFEKNIWSWRVLCGESWRVTS
jgi:hypothetical protein